MTDDGRPSDVPRAEPAGADSGAGPVDFAFLNRQTFGDVDLERDVLQLFVAQARRIVPGLPALSSKAQADAAHLLKGSARGIGAWEAADCADAYERAEQADRADRYVALAAAFDRAEAAILIRLGLPIP